MVKEKNEEIKKAVRVLDEMSMNEEEWQIYEDRQKALIRYDTEMKSAIEDGMEKGIEKVATKMLQNKIKTEIIMKMTGLTKEKIEQIKKEITTV